MHTLTSFDGIVFDDYDWVAAFPQEAQRGQWGINTRVTPRTGNTPVITTGDISPRILPIDLVYTGASDVRGAIDQIIGLLNPRDQRPRLLVGARYDATAVQRYATITLPSTFGSDDAVNIVRVVFTSEDPEWVKTTATTEDETGTVSPIQLAFTNAGQAAVHPRYRLRWETQRTTFATVVGQKYRKRMTLTNDQDITLGPFPWRITLGDTAALVSGGKAQADGDDLVIVINGESVDRKLIGWNLTMSFAWVVIPGLDAGEELTIDVLYGNTSATNPPTWGTLDADAPIPDMGSESGTATGGSTTTMVKASASWQTNEWAQGEIWMLTGDNAGNHQIITSNTGTTITHDAFSNTNDAGDTFLLVKSTNYYWIYAVRQTNRDTDDHRGRFYVNGRGQRPSIVSYESPGSWQPQLVDDNRDSFGVRRYSFLDNGTDEDTYALLDAERMWEGNDKRVPEAGSADGMSLVTPCPITEIHWEYQIDNPNGVIQAWVGVRGSGAEDWAEVWDDETASSTLTTRSMSDFSINTNFGDVWQIVTAIRPVDDIEIDLDWKRYDGSATSGTTTTTTDSLAEWATDQFDNGSIRMLSGANAGRKRGITSNTSTVITHSAFPAANADGDRYVLRNRRLKGKLRDGSKLVIKQDAGALTDSGLGTETEVYEMSCAIWVGDGPAGEPDGQHRALIGYHEGYTEKRMFLAIDEQAEIDAAARRIRIWNTTDEAYTREVTDPEVIIQYHDGTDWHRSANWMPIGPGDQQVWVGESQIGELGIEVVYYPSWLGA